MDQRFSQGSDAFEMTFEKENRRLAAVFLLIGVVCTWGTWYFGARGGILSGGRIVVLMLCGATLTFSGLVNVISPPKAEFRSEVNKRRNGSIALIGLVMGAVELYFYHDIYGIW